MRKHTLWTLSPKEEHRIDLPTKGRAHIITRVEIRLARLLLGRRRGRRNHLLLMTVILVVVVVAVPTGSSIGIQGTQLRIAQLVHLLDGPETLPNRVKHPHKTSEDKNALDNDARKERLGRWARHIIASGSVFVAKKNEGVVSKKRRRRKTT